MKSVEEKGFPNAEKSGRQATEDKGPSEPYGAVILYYKLGDQIETTIQSLLNQGDSPAQVVLVDNGSRDGVIDVIRSRFPTIETLTLDENLGYAGGMNAGAAEIRDECSQLLLLTHEVDMRSDCVYQLREALGEEGVLLAGPRLELAGNGAVWSAGGSFTRFGNTTHHTNISPGFTDIDWIDGACMLVDRAAFRAVAGFDESYFLYWEDVDFSSRIRSLGRVVCATDAIAAQSTGMTPVYFSSRNRISYWKKRSKPMRVFFAVSGGVVRILVKDLRRKNDRLKAAKARLHGILDGVTGSLNSRYGQIRE